MSSTTPPATSEAQDGAEERHRGRSRGVPLVFVLATVPLVALLTFATLAVVRGPGAEGVGAQVGQPAPDFALVDLSGDPIRLADLRGRPVVLNFWGSWCPPCVEEFPRLERAVDEHSDDGLVVIGVVYQDRYTSARDFMDSFGATWPAAMDPGGRVAAGYGIYGAPETFFIDRDGVVAARQIGPFTEDSLDRHLARILPEDAS